ncbi:kinase-like domain-containing protein [Cadophora sp. MPI-SDFR-AT-0126]|nr:kinase-like domain-containing protein [Leotiomycetes sp. MPI-SDFR-AT-0126]
MDRDWKHPERYIEGMVDFPSDLFFYSKATKSQLDMLKGKATTQLQTIEETTLELCRSCGWTAKNECHSSYVSRVRIMHTKANKGMWSLGGSQWILVDQPNDPDTLGNDFMTYEFLRKQPDCKIPLLKEIRCISQPNDPIRFLLMSRAEGVTLRSIWRKLTPAQRLSYSWQVADILLELRKFTSPVPQKVDGTPLDDPVIGVCLDLVPCCKKIGRTGKAWFADLAEELRHALERKHKTNDPTIIEEKLQELRERFPEQEPYVLSHGDLHPGNIMVKDGKIEAILDWEWAGYYPWWYERYRNRMIADQIKDELFGPIWEGILELSGGRNDKEYKAYIRPMADVMILYQTARREHPNHEGRWRRPAFCKCKPYGGVIQKRDIGGPTGHRVTGKGHDPERDDRETEMYAAEAKERHNARSWFSW